MPGAAERSVKHECGRRGAVADHRGDAPAIDANASDSGQAKRSRVTPQAAAERQSTLGCTFPAAKGGQLLGPHLLNRVPLVLACYLGDLTRRLRGRVALGGLVDSGR
jgi:hypothetical protein